MVRTSQPGWHRDPYRRHDLRYWDGRAWTAHVSDLGVVGDDPVFPVVDDAAGSFLATPHRRRLTGAQRAAALSIGGFLAVVTLAAASTASTTDGSPTSTSWTAPTARGGAAAAP